MSSDNLRADFNESSDEEEAEINLRKRRRNLRKSQLEFDDFKLLKNGFLDVETFLNEDLNWLKLSKDILDKTEQDNCEVTEQKPEFSLDLSTLELTQVIKHKKVETASPGKSNI